ncbi:MAG: S-methyl-5-thioribose-1-phosphate isomerase [Acidimicrobiales bacterium]
MLIDGTPMQTIRVVGDDVEVIDQTRLPHQLVLVRWRSVEDAARGIETMQVRGAPLIGVAAAHGVALAMRADPSDAGLAGAVARLARTRPTAVNLRWALEQMTTSLQYVAPTERASAATSAAQAMTDADVAVCRALGEAGLPLLEAVAERRKGPVRVLTHCNAGWLAAVDWGTALAPVFRAYEVGVPVEVWVSETRPRNQGALTAWELAGHGIDHRVVVDNACGHLLATGQVDVVLVGADRVAANGDAANKVGTYLKALAARASEVPFHVVAPLSTIDRQCLSGSGIPIEERDGEEVRRVSDGRTSVAVVATRTPVANPAFDVTPAALITSVVTEHGPVAASAAGIAGLPWPPDKPD